LIEMDVILFGPIQLGEWHREYWWYKLLKVCQQWPYVILESASHLGLCLVCARGMPVEDILAHSPPLLVTMTKIIASLQRMKREYR